MTQSNKLDWCVYDLINDEPVGVWPTYQDCQRFFIDNFIEGSNDNWEIMPYVECQFAKV